MKRPLSSLVAPLAAALALAGMPGSGLARMEVHPRLTLQQEYNDNIYLEPESTEDDFITTVSPGLTLAWLTRALHLDLDYGFYFRTYLDHGGEDETSLKDTQRGKGTAVFFPDRDFSLVLEDEYSRVPLDVRDPLVEENLLVNKTNLNRLRINPRCRLRPRPTFRIALDYRYEKLAYDDPAGDDAGIHGASLELARELSGRLSVTAGYEIERRDNDLSADYRRQVLYAGASRQFGTQFSLEVRGGPVWIDFPGDDEDRSIFGGLAAARLGLGRRMTVLVRGLREFDIATVDGLFERQSLEAGIAYGPAGGEDGGKNRLQAELTTAWTRDDYYRSDREDESLGAAFAGRFPLGRYLALLAGASYADVTFEPEGEQVDRYGGSGALEFRRRWLLVSLGYLFRESDSDIDDNDYRNHIVTLSATVRF